MICYNKNLYKTHPSNITFMAGLVGIEPTSTVLETAVLPLYYSPKTLKLFLGGGLFGFHTLG